MVAPTVRNGVSGVEGQKSWELDIRKQMCKGEMISEAHSEVVETWDTMGGLKAPSKFLKDYLISLKS